MRILCAECAQWHDVAVGCDIGRLGRQPVSSEQQACADGLEHIALARFSALRSETRDENDAPPGS